MPSAESFILLSLLWNDQIVRWVVWVGLVVLTVALLVLVRTRWGQSQPLSKCIVLSLVAHLLLGIYMTTVNIVTHQVGAPDGKGIQVALVDSSGGDAASDENDSHENWDALVGADSPATTDAVLKDWTPKLSPVELPPDRESPRPPTFEPSRPMVPITPPPALRPTNSLRPPPRPCRWSPRARSSKAPRRSRYRILRPTTSLRPTQSANRRSMRTPNHLRTPPAPPKRTACRHPQTIRPLVPSVAAAARVARACQKARQELAARV